MTALLTLVFYGALAGVALWATSRHEELRWLGGALVFGYVLSNILYFAGPITARPGPYTMIEIIVALTAYCSWSNLGYKTLVAIVVVNIISTGINIYFAALGPEPSKWQSHAFGLGTNVCFAVECILATSAGVNHGYCSGRFSRRLHLPWRTAQPNAVSKDQS